MSWDDKRTPVAPRDPRAETSNTRFPPAPLPRLEPTNQDILDSIASIRADVAERDRMTQLAIRQLGNAYNALAGRVSAGERKSTETTGQFEARQTALAAVFSSALEVNKQQTGETVAAAVADIRDEMATIRADNAKQTKTTDSAATLQHKSILVQAIAGILVAAIAAYGAYMSGESSKAANRAADKQETRAHDAR